MTSIIKPLRWWDMVSPTEEEMPDFLRAYMGKGMQFRTPKRMWEDLWMRKRGEMNHVIGMRKAGTIANFKGPKYQKGIICATAFGVAADGTEPNLQNITNATSSISPAPSRQQYAYDSDGGIEGDTDAGTEATIVYVTITTQTDDTNNHTNDWWPDQPDTNEGLNWDIRYLNEALTGSTTGIVLMHLLADNTGVNRTSATWYLLDTISNDHVIASHDGGIGVNRNNGTTKDPAFGVTTLDVDVEIRATGSGSAVTSMHFDLDVEGTVV